MVSTTTRKCFEGIVFQIYVRYPYKSIKDTGLYFANAPLYQKYPNCTGSLLLKDSCWLFQKPYINKILLEPGDCLRVVWQAQFLLRKFHWYFDYKNYKRIYVICLDVDNVLCTNTISAKH